MKDKKELIRVVRTELDGKDNFTLDSTGKKPGRGAYVCHNPECLKRAIKSKALSRAFGVEIPQSVMEALHEQMEILNEP